MGDLDEFETPCNKKKTVRIPATDGEEGHLEIGVLCQKMTWHNAWTKPQAMSDHYATLEFDGVLIEFTWPDT